MTISNFLPDIYQIEHIKDVRVCFKDVFSSNSFITLRTSILTLPISIIRKTSLMKKIWGVQLYLSKIFSQSSFTKNLMCARIYRYRTCFLGTHQSAVENAAHQKATLFTLNQQSIICVLVIRQPGKFIMVLFQAAVNLLDLQKEKQHKTRLPILGFSCDR